MEKANQGLNGFVQWKAKFRNLKNNIMELESRESSRLKIYHLIMQGALMSFGIFVFLSGMMTPLRELKSFVVLGVILMFLLFVACPLCFEYKNVQRLNPSNRQLITERKRLCESCISLLNEYNYMCAVAFSIKDAPGSLFEEISAVDMKKIKNFGSENADLVFQAKYYPKFLILMVILGLIYAVTFISAFYVFVQDVPKVSSHRSRTSRRSYRLSVSLLRC